jgi:outer membrane protein assembly factor BamE (lipoprotein component of BamABCDE complex)
MKALYIAIIAAPLLAGCQHQAYNGSEDTKQITLGTVQSQVKKGVSSSEVIEALGSPNVISTDKEGREVWVYDKFATENSSSGASTGLIPGLFVNASSSSSSTSQSTMTIIVKFDKNHLVRDVAYHRSKF